MKSKSIFTCSACGATYNKWVGKCDNCNEWNTVSEEVISKGVAKKRVADIKIVSLAAENLSTAARIDTGIGECNRVLGGGLVPGSAVLIGGNPGIGKSTLLLQLAANLEAAGREVLYASGEESNTQVALRAKRLGIDGSAISFTGTTDVDDLVSVINSHTKLDLLIIDSIQTVFSGNIASPPGTVSQVKYCANELIVAAKARSVTLILVGHVTKDGGLAGPKMLEHMVDTVIYFKSYNHHDYRMIRTFKNRFGAVNEIGLFAMKHEGLAEIANPSQLFLDSEQVESSGNAVVVSMEGTRPIVAEAQSLIAPSFMASPRRAVVGWDVNRLSVMIAIINSKLNINLLNKEVYLNIVGGLKITEPAVDLAVVASLLSAVIGCIIPKNFVFCGEVGLAGEVRSVPYAEARISEVEKLGFTKIIMARAEKGQQNSVANDKKGAKLQIVPIKHIRELLNILKNLQVSE